MGEGEPLLCKLEKESDAEKASVTWIRDSIKKRRRVHSIVCAASLIAVGAVLVVATVIGTAVFLADFLHHQSVSKSCHDIPSFVATNSRSGSYSLLDAISLDRMFLMCYKPRAQVSLYSMYSQVDVYRTFCGDIETSAFQVQYVLYNISSSGVPLPVFNENYTPHNYFMGGTIRIDIINATSTSPLVDVNVCLFTNKNDYDNFIHTRGGWKNSTKNGVCNSRIAGKNFVDNVSFNVSKPSFVFLAMVTANYVHVDRLNISANGREITGPGKNHSNKVCQLDGEHTVYSFDLLQHQIECENKDVCIVAYEIGNADGSYDYSNLSISLPYQTDKEPDYKELQGFGYSFLGIVTVSIASLLVFALVKVRSCGRNRRPVTCVPIQASNQDGPTQKKEQSSNSLFHKV